jgi:translation initiation factor 2B subunit (eIF-2B alpha/beta/delta family)
MSKSAKAERRALKGTSEKNSEKLKGRIRELAKEVEKWKRYALSLEKQLIYSPEQIEEMKANKKKKKEEKVEIPKEKDRCSNCAGTDTIKNVLWTPTGERIILHCNSCNHKEKL